ncbi:MAG TPA: hypothetical protein VNI01_08115 [Elusimicrobiota bacterium]|jgi:hypothetical protein|nr:hypothetical protein [Elusimicrobiota bacterium]
MGAPGLGEDPIARRWTRRLGALVLIAGLAWAYGRWGALGLRALDRAVYPAPPKAPSPLASAIETEARARRMNAFLLWYGQVSRSIEAAQARGADVSALTPKMARALDVARSGNLEAARRYLNAVELQVPRPSEQVRPVGDQDLLAPAAESSAVPRRRRRAGAS